MSGFPTRPDRNAFGATMVNSGAVRDPSRHLDASVWNLMAWQVAGLGLLAPRAMLYFNAAAFSAIVARAEAWNPKREGSGAYADPEITVNGAGNYTVAWPSSIPDELGNALSLAFSFAQAFPVNADPSVLKKAQAAIVSGTPYQIRVCVFDAAGALEHGNDVVVLGY
jgi:hypothetical protein